MSKETENKKFYTNYVTHLLNVRHSGIAQFDKSILTLSVTILGISMAFIRDLIDPTEMMMPVLLKMSWLSFGLSIVITLTSFLTSQRALEIQIDLAFEYYIEENEDAMKKTNKAGRITDFLNRISAVTFILAILLMMAFIWVNF